MRLAEAVRLFAQGLLVCASFLGPWAALAQVDWLRWLKPERAQVAAEEKFGALVWQEIKRKYEFVHDATIDTVVSEVRTRLCEVAAPSTCAKSVYVIREDEVNAFALPSGRILVTTGLLQEVASEEELAGVLAHEMAHVELGHVTTKLVKDLGLASILSAAAGAEAVKQALYTLSSTAYDRRLESAADLHAVDVLVRAEVEPRALADLTFRLGQRTGSTPALLQWFSTHPGNEDRAQAILEHAADQSVTPREIVTPELWRRFTDVVR